MDKNKKRGMGILVKILLMCFLPMVLLGVIITVYSVNVLKAGMQGEALSALSYLCQSVSAAYDAIDPGDYRMDGDLLYKGDFCITENEDIVDSFTKGTDADITLFFGDTRRATSLLDAQTGERIVGTTASDVVTQNVLNKGQEYTATNININNKNYYAYYKPLKNSDGQIVGMVFAGEPSASVDAIISKRMYSIIGISVVILLISVIICVVLIRKIVSVITYAEKMLKGISDGDLYLQLNEKARKTIEKARNRDDEIGTMVTSMFGLIERLQSIVSKIGETMKNLIKAGESLESVASQTNATTGEISRAIEEVSRGAVMQAEEIESATMQISDIGSLMNSIVGSVKELDEVSANMKKADDESEQIINELSVSNDKTIAAIKKIDASVHTTNESVEKIQEAVNLITSIASQTSMLALNASIEAARAGEAGRGFAVVASQISKLSEDSNSSAKTIEEIIHQLSADSEASVKIMAEVEEIIAEQQTKLNATKEKFNDVSKGIDVTMSETEQIYGQTKECDEARIKVTDVIENLSAISQENAASTEETNASMQELNMAVGSLAEAAKNLKNIADELKQDISFFRI